MTRRRFGARNGPPAARFGMKGRNDSTIRLARTGAKLRGHALKAGEVAADREMRKAGYYR